MEAIKVNLIPNGIPQTCHASQYDEGRQIRLDLFDGFTPYAIKSGDTFTLDVRKPDNHVIIETITGTEGNTYLVIETTEQMTAVMGKNLCEIRVENDGDNIGSLNFIMEVEKDVIANGIPSESVIEDLDALVAEAVGDDFYTKSEVDNKIAALIDDESAASNKTWSSEKIDEAVNSIQDELDLVESLTITTEEQTITDDLSETVTKTTGFMAKDGRVYTGGSYDNYYYTNKIAVNEGDVVFGSSFRIVTAFDSDNTALTAKGAENTQSATGYTVPSGVAFVVLTIANAGTTIKRTYQTTVNKNILSDRVETLENETESALWLLNNKPRYKTATRSTMNDGNSLSVITWVCEGLAKGERVIFNANITSFSSLIIGLILNYSSVADATQRYNTFEIDGTNVSYKKTSTDEAVVVAHGLTLADNIQVILETSENGKIKFTLVSSGELFTHTFDFARHSYSAPFVYSVGSSLTDCILSFTCSDLEKKIWYFGDSYCSYNNARPYYYLQNYGYAQNMLLNAFAGCGSAWALSSLRYLLNYGSPKYCVWATGMNDGSDSGSAPSSTWVTARDSFITACTENKITPIFCTVPTVPSVNNEKKNAWIRSSGYRFIDFAKAVGANSSGEWFSDMLSVDNVHPTEKGAKALFARALLDFPELMIGGFDTPTLS